MKNFTQPRYYITAVSPLFLAILFMVAPILMFPFELSAVELAEDQWSKATWAKDVAEGILDAQSGNTPDETSKLFELDIEVDMLASALLTLDHPDLVMELYDTYLASGNKRGYRTPASILLYARALRNLALKNLTAVDDSTFTPGDRGKAFDNANIYMSRAMNQLHDIRISFSLSESSPFIEWVSKGLPKPDDLSQWEAGEFKREPFPMFQALDYIRLYIEWEARVARELGDLIYKKNGSGLAGSKKDVKENATALAYYLQAREALFLGRLLFAEDKTMLTEADKVEDRIQWIKSGEQYGGVDFFQFQYYSDSNNLNHWKKQLDQSYDQLKNSLTNTDSSKREAQKWCGNVETLNNDRKKLKKRFEQQMAYQIQTRIKDKKLDLAKLNSTSAYNRLTTVYKQAEFVMDNVAIYSDADWRKSELELEKNETNIRANDTAAEILEAGQLPQFKEKLKSEYSQDNKYDATVKRLELSFSDSEANSPLAKLYHFLKDVERNGTSGKGKIDDLNLLYEKAAIELEIAESELAYYDTAERLKNIETNELKPLKDEIKRTDESIQEAINNQNIWRQAFVDRTVYDRVKNQVIPKLENERASAIKKVDNIQGQIKKFKKYVGETRQAIQKIRKARETVSKAYDAFKAIISKVSSLPTTIVAGPNSGTMFNKGETVNINGRAILSAIEAAYNELIEKRSFDEILNNLEKEADKLNGHLDKAKNVAMEAESKLKTQMDEIATGAHLQLPPKDFIEQIDQEIKDLLREDELNQLMQNISNIELKSRKLLTKLNLSDSAVSSNDRTKVGELQAKIQTLLNKKSKVLWDRLERIIEKIGAHHDEDVGENYATLWKAHMTKKAQLELHKNELEIRQAEARARQEACRKYISAHERSQLQRRVEVGKKELASSNVKIDMAINKQEYTWYKLIKLLERYDIVTSDQEELTAFRESAQKIIKKLKDDIDSGRMDVNEKNKKLMEESSKAESELSQLAIELEQMEKPEGRIVMADMLSKIAPALTAMKRYGQEKGDFRAKLEEANAYLLNYARWLYLFSADEKCITFSTRCDSLAELKLSMSELKNLEKDITDKIKNPHVSTMALQLQKSDIQKMKQKGFSGSGFSLRIVPEKSGNTPEEWFIDNNAGKIYGDDKDDEQPDTKYQSLHAYSPDIDDIHSNFVVFRPSKEAEYRPILLSYLPVPEWEESGILHMFSSSCFLDTIFKKWNASSDQESEVSCFPQGTVVISANSTDEPIPVWYKENLYTLSRNNSNYEGFAAALIKGYSGQRDSSTSILAGPSTFPGPEKINVESFGHGLNSTYSIKFDESFNIDNLNNFTLYLFYADRIGASRTTVASSAHLSLKDLELSGDSENKSDANATSDILNLSGNHDAGEQNISPEALERAFEDKLKSILTGHVSTLNEDHKKNREDSDGSRNLMRPISLYMLTKACHGIVSVFYERVKKEYFSPLETAQSILEKDQAPFEQIRDVNNCIATQNKRFDTFRKHIEMLDKTRKVLNSLEFSGDDEEKSKKLEQLKSDLNRIEIHAKEKLINELYQKRESNEGFKKKLDAIISEYILMQMYSTPKCK